MNDLGGAQLGSERQSRQEPNHCPGQVQGVGMNQGQPTQVPRGLSGLGTSFKAL